MKVLPPQSCLAIIPARGGSKRIPDKNIKLFNGKPIIAYSIEAAKATGLFDHVVVSTDSEAIAKVAREWGAEVPFLRDDSVSGDKAGLHSVMHDALTRLSALGIHSRYACCLLATAPLMLAEDIMHGYEAIREASAQMSLSVTTFPYCIFRGLKKDDSGRAVMLWPENLTRHSQEFPEAFHDAGQFYWFDVELFVNDPGVFFSDAVPVFLPRSQVQDIDNLEDWEQAELLYRQMHP
ncbi:MAG: neuA [Verrucomicrobiaceae bacterium]|nr:neuA [Verrucomicrobiaceae bacterium]